MAGPVVSVVVVNYRTPKLAAECLDSLRRHQGPVPAEALVVDNASGDGSAEYLAGAAPWARVVRSGRNLGFGGGCNLGAGQCLGRHLFFLNPDAVVHEDTPGILSGFLDEHPGAAVVGCAIRDAAGNVQPSAAYFPSLLRVLAGRDVLSGLVRRRLPRMTRLARALTFYLPPGELAADCRVDWVVGAAFMVRRDVFEAVGGFDESIFLYGEEIDLQKRIAGRGGEVWFTPRTSVTHLEAQSLGGSDSPERLARVAAGHRRYYRMHHGAFGGTLMAGVEVLASAVKWVVWAAVCLVAPTTGRRGKLRWHANYLRAVLAGPTREK